MGLGHIMDGMSLLCQACWLSIQSFAKRDHVLHRQRADAKNPVSYSGAFVMVDGRREQLVSANYYKTLTPVPLQNLPRLQSVMRTLLADPQIHVDFLTCQLASKILKHAYARIHHLISTSVKFKIGLTADPCHRWRHAAHSYCLEKPRIFQSMKLLAILEHGEAVAMLEAALIATFISHEACLNVAEGGESISKIDGPFFVYAVVSG